MTIILAFEPGDIKTARKQGPFDIKLYGLRKTEAKSKQGLSRARSTLLRASISSFYISVNRKNTIMLSMLHLVNLKDLKILLGDNSYVKKKGKKLDQTVYIRHFRKAFEKPKNIALELETATFDKSFLAQLSNDVKKNPKRFNSIQLEYTDLARHLDSVRILERFCQSKVNFMLKSDQYLDLDALEKVTLCKLELNISLNVDNLITLMKIRFNMFCKNVLVILENKYTVSHLVPVAIIKSNDNFRFDLKKPPAYGFSRQKFNMLLTSNLLAKKFHVQNETQFGNFRKKYDSENISFLARINKIRANSLG